eukprot:402081-Pyramimonas_sp.AAC.1
MCIRDSYDEWGAHLMGATRLPRAASPMWLPPLAGGARSYSTAWADTSKYNNRKQRSRLLATHRFRTIIKVIEEVTSATL